MNKKFNIIINTLIIMLIIALVMVMMNYYADTDSIPTFIYNSGDTSISSPSGDNPKEIIDKILSGEKSGDAELAPVSGESESGDIIGENQKPDKSDSPLIMTSENEISSKEKREILTELDKTLMDLLEVVDRVQIVDETRLVTDDSEVQEWKGLFY